MELFQWLWDLLVWGLDLLLHLDHHLNNLTAFFGPWTYLILFLIIFCETGLVVTPFLPGDSLLFALGALAANPDSNLHVGWLVIILIVAAILGDFVNYSIGKWVGPRVFDRPDSRWIKKSHLEKTRDFYNRHGGKAIVLARFIPIFRTFVPFIAGIGEMNYRKFMSYNISGGIAWVVLLTFAGYFFGAIPIVRDNFGVVVPAIIVISLIPVFVEIAKHKFGKAKNHDPHSSN